jgi:competence protein ComGC
MRKPPAGFSNILQPDDRKSSIKKNKKGQEEIVGFIVIVVIISVILLVLLSFMIKDKDSPVSESYEIESFIQAMLQYTTECESYTEHLSLQKLITYCGDKTNCVNGIESCKLLNETVKGIIDSSWIVNEQSAVIGYELLISSEEDELISIQKGNKTANYKGSFQDFSVRGEDYLVSLNVYE